MKKDSGKAMLELAVVLPFFIILLFVVIDIFFIIQRTQHLSLLVREVASLAYRECVTASAGISSNNCLETSTSEARSLTDKSSTLSGAKVIVRSWLVSPAVAGNILKGEFNPTKSNSLFTSDGVRTLNSYDSNLREGLITVEVFLPSNLNTSLFNKNLYDSVIF